MHVYYPFYACLDFFRKYNEFSSENELNKFIFENHLNKFVAMVLRKKVKHLLKKETSYYGGMCGNIMEALRSEEDTVNKTNFFTSSLNRKKSLTVVDNVKAGLALILYLEKYKDDFPVVEYKEKNFLLTEHLQSDSTFWNDLYAYTTQKNYIRVWEIASKPWVDLYLSWNVGFILRRAAEKLHLFLPKLLITSVLLSKSENFVFTRVMALWLTMNFTYSLCSNKIKTEYETTHLESFLTILGENNVLYAKNVLFKTNIDLDKLYKERIQNRSSIANYIDAIKLMNL